MFPLRTWIDLELHTLYMYKALYYKQNGYKIIQKILNILHKYKDNCKYLACTVLLNRLGIQIRIVYLLFLMFLTAFLLVLLCCLVFVYILLIKLKSSTCSYTLIYVLVKYQLSNAKQSNPDILPFKVQIVVQFIELHVVVCE